MKGQIVPLGLCWSFIYLSMPITIERPKRTRGERKIQVCASLAPELFEFVDSVADENSTSLSRAISELLHIAWLATYAK